MGAIVPTPAQRRVLERHLDELEAWNRRVNLTTVAREHAWERHVEESLWLAAVADLAPGARCVDIGSGAGFPGIPVAVVRPDVSMTLVEADRRKAGFLMHVAGLLGLSNVTVVAQRAERMAADVGHRGSYHAAVSRGAAPPTELVGLAMPLLRPNGRLWALVTDAASVAGVVHVAGARAAAAAPGILVVEKHTPRKTTS